MKLTLPDYVLKTVEFKKDVYVNEKIQLEFGDDQMRNLRQVRLTFGPLVQVLSVAREAADYVTIDEIAADAVVRAFSLRLLRKQPILPLTAQLCELLQKAHEVKQTNCYEKIGEHDLILEDDSSITLSDNTRAFGFEGTLFVFTDSNNPVISELRLEI